MSTYDVVVRIKVHEADIEPVEASIHPIPRGDSDTDNRP